MVTGVAEDGVGGAIAIAELAMQMPINSYIIIIMILLHVHFYQNAGCFSHSSILAAQ